jgi:exodeoxyribonuclease VII small subunit
MTQESTFEQALAELESVVERLQRPDLPLDEALALYRRGTELAARSERLLSAAELQVQQLTRAVQERFEEYSLDQDAASEEAAREEADSPESSAREL